MKTHEHRIVSRQEFDAENRKLLDRDLELSRQYEELARDRRELPRVLIDKDYTFDTTTGNKSLADLFEGRSQLLVYHMMFGPEWTGGCPACSAVVDQLDGEMAHLNAHDVTMVVISHAPLEKLQAYRKRMGWKFNYVSAFNTDFNYDFGVSFTDELNRDWADEAVERMSKDPLVVELATAVGTDVRGYVTKEGPGLSSFVMDGGRVYLATSYPPDPGPLFMLGYQQLLQRTAKGYDDKVILRRHDEYRT